MKTKRVILFGDYADPTPPPQLMQSTLRAAKAASHRPARSFGLAAQLRVQVAYISPLYWLGAVSVFALAGVLLWAIARSGGEPAQALLSLCVLALAGPLLAALAAPELAKSSRHDMQELENAAPLNLPRLTSLRLLITGGVALPLLALLLPLAPAPLPFALALTALMAPFLLSCAGCYLVLGLLRGNAAVVGCVGACFVVVLLLAAAFTATGGLGGWAATPAAIHTVSYALLPASLALYLGAAGFYVKKQSPERN